MTYTIVTNPGHGTLGALNGATLTYQPAAGYSGLDSFTYKVTENGLDSNVATVSITVAHVNHPPVASDGRRQRYKRRQSLSRSRPAIPMAIR